MVLAAPALRFVNTLTGVAISRGFGCRETPCDFSAPPCLRSAANGPSRKNIRCKSDWPELARLSDQIRPEDVVVVTCLDHLPVLPRDLREIADKLRAAEAGPRSLHEPWADTASPAGGMVLTI